MWGNRKLWHRPLLTGLSVFLAAVVLWCWPGVPSTERSVHPLSQEVAKPIEENTIPIGKVQSFRKEFQHGDRHTPLECSCKLANATASKVKILRIRSSCVCAVTQIAGHELPPGGSVPITFRIKNFDSYQSRFTEFFEIETTAGLVGVYLAGSLPAPTKVLCRPEVLYLKKNKQGKYPTRTTTVLVPDVCHQLLTAEKIRFLQHTAARVQLRHTVGTDAIHEYVLAVTLPDELPQGWNGDTMVVQTGCGEVQIVLHVEK